MFYALEKFRPYILGSMIIIYTDHAALKYLFSKKEAKHDSYDGCCSLKNLTWRLKTRKAAKTRWRTTYRVSTSREERRSEIHFQTSISSPSRVTPPGTRTSSTLSSLDRSRSTGTGIKKISSSTSSSTICRKNRFCST